MGVVISNNNHISSSCSASVGYSEIIDNSFYVSNKSIKMRNSNGRYDLIEDLPGINNEISSIYSFSATSSFSPSFSAFSSQNSNNFSDKINESVSLYINKKDEKNSVKGNIKIEGIKQVDNLNEYMEINKLERNDLVRSISGGSSISSSSNNNNSIIICGNSNRKMKMCEVLRKASVESSSNCMNNIFISRNGTNNNTVDKGSLKKDSAFNINTKAKISTCNNNNHKNNHNNNSISNFNNSLSLQNFKAFDSSCLPLPVLCNSINTCTNNVDVNPCDNGSIVNSGASNIFINTKKSSLPSLITSFSSTQVSSSVNNIHNNNSVSEMLGKNNYGLGYFKNKEVNDFLDSNKNHNNEQKIKKKECIQHVDNIDDFIEINRLERIGNSNNSDDFGNISDINNSPRMKIKLCEVLRKASSSCSSNSISSIGSGDNKSSAFGARRHHLKSTAGIDNAIIVNKNNIISNTGSSSSKSTTAVDINKDNDDGEDILGNNLITKSGFCGSGVDIKGGFTSTGNPNFNISNSFSVASGSLLNFVAFNEPHSLLLPCEREDNHEISRFCSYFSCVDDVKEDSSDGAIKVGNSGSGTTVARGDGINMENFYPYSNSEPRRGAGNTTVSGEANVLKSREDGNCAGDNVNIDDKVNNTGDEKKGQSRRDGGKYKVSGGEDNNTEDNNKEKENKGSDEKEEKVKEKEDCSVVMPEETFKSQLLLYCLDENSLSIVNNNSSSGDVVVSGSGIGRIDNKEKTVYNINISTGKSFDICNNNTLKSKAHSLSSALIDHGGKSFSSTSCSDFNNNDNITENLNYNNRGSVTVMRCFSEEAKSISPQNNSPSSQVLTPVPFDSTISIPLKKATNSSDTKSFDNATDTTDGISSGSGTIEPCVNNATTNTGAPEAILLSDNLSDCSPLPVVNSFYFPHLSDFSTNSLSGFISEPDQTQLRPKNISNFGKNTEEMKNVTGINRNNSINSTIISGHKDDNHGISSNGNNALFDKNITNKSNSNNNSSIFSSFGSFKTNLLPDLKPANLFSYPSSYSSLVVSSTPLSSQYPCFPCSPSASASSASSYPSPSSLEVKSKGSFPCTSPCHISGTNPATDAVRQGVLVRSVPNKLFFCTSSLISSTGDNEAPCSTTSEGIDNNNSNVTDNKFNSVINSNSPDSNNNDKNIRHSVCDECDNNNGNGCGSDSNLHIYTTARYKRLSIEAFFRHNTPGFSRSNCINCDINKFPSRNVIGNIGTCIPNSITPSRKQSLSTSCILNNNNNNNNNNKISINNICNNNSRNNIKRNSCFIDAFHTVLPCQIIPDEVKARLSNKNVKNINKNDNENCVDNNKNNGINSGQNNCYNFIYDNNFNNDINKNDNNLNCDRDALVRNHASSLNFGDGKKTFEDEADIDDTINHTRRHSIGTTSNVNNIHHNNNYSYNNNNRCFIDTFHSVLPCQIIPDEVKARLSNKNVKNININDNENCVDNNKNNGINSSQNNIGIIFSYKNGKNGDDKGNDDKSTDNGSFCRHSNYYSGSENSCSNVCSVIRDELNLIKDVELKGREKSSDATFLKNSEKNSTYFNSTLFSFKENIGNNNNYNEGDGVNSGDENNGKSYLLNTKHGNGKRNNFKFEEGKLKENNLIDNIDEKLDKNRDNTDKLSSKDLSIDLSQSHLSEVDFDKNIFGNQLYSTSDLGSLSDDSLAASLI